LCQLQSCEHHPYIINPYQLASHIHFNDAEQKPLPSQSQCQNQQTDVAQHTQRRQNNHDIPTRPKPLPPQPILPDFRKELSIPLHSPERTYPQHTSPIDCKQSSNTIELGCKDLENYQSEAELS
jgi:hypothetical protein